MKSKRVQIDTGRKPVIVDITATVAEFVSEEPDGLVNIALPHATAGLVVMELGSGSEADLLDRVKHLLPRQDIYRHSHGSHGHGGDHLLPAFISPTLTLPVQQGRIVLGTWQSIAIVDTNIDNPNRELVLSFIAG